MQFIISFGKDENMTTNGQFKESKLIRAGQEVFYVFLFCLGLINFETLFSQGHSL